MRVMCCVIGALLLLAAAGTDAVAGPDRKPGATPNAARGDARRPPVAPEIAKLKAEIRKIEKQLAKAKKKSDAPSDKLRAQERRLQAARKQLAGVLSRMRQGRARAPAATRRRPAESRRGHRGGRETRGQGPGVEWMGIVKRLHEQNRQLSERIGRLEKQIRHVIGAVRKHAERPAAAKAPARGLMRSGPQAAARPGHGPRPATRSAGPEAIEARLARIEGLLTRLVAHAARAHGARDAKPGRNRGAQRTAHHPREQQRARQQGGKRSRGMREGRRSQRMRGRAPMSRGPWFSAMRQPGARGMGRSRSQAAPTGPWRRMLLRRRLMQGGGRGAGMDAGSMRHRQIGRAIGSGFGRARGKCPHCDA